MIVPQSNAKLSKIEDCVSWLLPHTNNAIKGNYPIPMEKVGTDTWYYVLGSSAVVATRALLDRLRSKYPQYSHEKWIKMTKHMEGNVITDCNGAFDGYLRTVSKLGLADTNANNNFAVWCKGNNGKSIDDCPNLLGTMLFMTRINGTKHHVGIISGFTDSGEPIVFEAASFLGGVRILPMGKREWDSWGLAKKVFDYSNVEESTKDLIKS